MKSIPLSESMFTAKDKNRFWNKVDIRGADECWLWKTARFACGYGNFGIFGRPHRASRIAFVLATGGVEDGMCVLHSCDNRACCNPKHLFTGTHFENMQDMKTKGRGAIGTKHGRSKLKEEAIIKIRAAYSSGATLLSLSNRFGVSFSNISRIINRKLWANVS